MDGNGNIQVLLWGLPPDGPLLAVRNALVGLGADVTVFDQRHVLAARIDTETRSGPALLVPSETETARSLLLDDVDAVFPRPYDTWAIGCLRRAASFPPALRHVLRLEGELWAWMASCDALVVNPAEAAATNATKPLQSVVAHSIGFEVPETLLTTSAEAARKFVSGHGEVVYKALGGTRTIARLLDPADDVRFARVGTCPVHLQRFVRGTNVRVHVVGGQAWACEVRGQHTDWRYPAEGDEITMASAAPPPEVLERCVSLTAALGLYLSGIDLVRDQSGRYFFLEANTSPGFTCFPASDEIALAVATLLVSARPGRSPLAPASTPRHLGTKAPVDDHLGPVPDARQFAGTPA